jgi:RNA polymerase sigma factor (sigma-70 family)
VRPERTELKRRSARCDAADGCPPDNLDLGRASAVCDSFGPQTGLPCRDRSDPIDRDTCVTGEEPFERFVHDVRGRLQRALVAAYGPEIGREAAADALTWAWANWRKVEAMTNPGGYLYRVGQSQARRYRRQQRAAPMFGVIVARSPATSNVAEDVELRRALGRLTTRQRTAVLLVHGHAYTLEETAESLGCSISTLRNHLQRGLSRLRRELGVGDG